jgi:uncharacterized protein (TIGR03086 family)
VSDERADVCCGIPAGRLLSEAISYALGNVAVVTHDLLGRPTPCRSWDLHALLWHCCESLTALEEGFTSGVVRLAADGGNDRVDLRVGGLAGSIATRAFAARAAALLDAAAWTRSPDVNVGDQCLATSLLAAAGALEIVVHGWDIGQASGSPRAIPQLLATRLLEVAPDLVSDADRAPLFAAPLFAAPLSAAPLFAAPLFAAPVTVGRDASASDKLIAFLGRAVVPASPWVPDPRSPGGQRSPSSAG